MSGCRKQKKKYKYKHPRRRRDMVTRMLVDLGISYAFSLGIERTSAFLRNKDVPEGVIYRVIKSD